MECPRFLHFFCVTRYPKPLTEFFFSNSAGVGFRGHAGALMAMAFSNFFIRICLALILSATLTVFLHSQVSLMSILTDTQTGAFNKPMLQPVLQWVVPLLPPLEWFDLRVLVGYQAT